MPALHKFYHIKSKPFFLALVHDNIFLFLFWLVSIVAVICTCLGNPWLKQILFHFQCHLYFYSFLFHPKYFFSITLSVLLEFQLYWKLKHALMSPMFKIPWERLIFVEKFIFAQIYYLFCIHVIFVIGWVFIYVELSNTIWLIILPNNCFFCHLIFISVCRGIYVDYSDICW